MNWTIKKEVNLSQIISIAVMIITFAVGYINMQSNVEDNTCDIIELKKETEASVLALQGTTKTIIAEQVTINTEVHDFAIVQKRTLRWIELIAIKMNIDYVE